jgi:hypothetical protein
MTDVVISAAGKFPKIDVIAPDGSKPDVKSVVDLPGVVVSFNCSSSSCQPDCNRRMFYSPRARNLLTCFSSH